MVISEPRLGLKRKGAGPEEKMLKREMGGSGEEKVGQRPKWGKKGKKLIARSSIEPTCQSEAGSSLPFPALVDSGAKPRGSEGVFSCENFWV